MDEEEYGEFGEESELGISPDDDAVSGLDFKSDDEETDPDSRFT